jgi:ketosteroid isomerase-like protein
MRARYDRPMDSAATTPITIARALHAALEAGRHGEDLRPLFTEDAMTLEHPNLVKPDGATSTLPQMLAASTAGTGLLSKQRYRLVDAQEVGDLAVLRVRWTGVIAQDVGPFHAGQELVAHIAQFVHVRDARIASIETYDCYEPFA